MTTPDIEYLRLVTGHQAAIYGYIRSLAPNGDIDDILQETNLILWEKSRTFQPGSNFKAFAFRIAHLKTLEALRAQRRRQWLVFDTDLLDSIAQHQTGPGAFATGHQAALRHCLLELSSEDRRLGRNHLRLRRHRPHRRQLHPHPLLAHPRPPRIRQGHRRHPGPSPRLRP